MKQHSLVKLMHHLDAIEVELDKIANANNLPTFKEFQAGDKSKDGDRFVQFYLNNKVESE